MHTKFSTEQEKTGFRKCSLFFKLCMELQTSVWLCKKENIIQQEHSESIDILGEDSSLPPYCLDSQLESQHGGLHHPNFNQLFFVSLQSYAKNSSNSDHDLLCIISGFLTGQSAWWSGSQLKFYTSSFYNTRPCHRISLHQFLTFWVMLPTDKLTEKNI